MEPVQLPVQDTDMVDARGQPTKPQSSEYNRLSIGKYVEMLADVNVVVPTRPNFFFCPVDCLLYKMVIDYYNRSGIQVILYHPETETEQEKETRNTVASLDKHYLLVRFVNGSTYVELHSGTIRRTFEMFEVLPSEAEWKSKELSITMGDMGLEASRDPSNPAEWFDCAKTLFPDFEVVYWNSIPLHRAYEKYVDTTEDKPRKSREQFFFEEYRASNRGFSDPDYCEALYLGGVSESRRKGKKIRYRGFLGGLCVLGTSGYGVGFMLARRKKDDKMRLYVIDLAGPERPVAKYLKLEGTPETTEGEEKTKEDGSKSKPPAKVFDFRLDIDSVEPCWVEVGGLHTSSTDTYRTAVSAQRALVGQALSVAVAVGSTDKTSILSVALDSLAVFVYGVSTVVDNHGLPRRPACSMVLTKLPFAPAIPSFVVVSNSILVAVFANMRDKEGKIMPPHMWAIELTYDAKRNTLGVAGDWLPFAIEMPVLSPTDPVPRSLMTQVEAGELPPVLSGSFDAYDPCELILGTFDGGLLPFHFARDPATRELTCTSRGIAPYITPNYLYELAEVKLKIEQCANLGKELSEADKRQLLEHVGRFRCGVTSIFSSFGTHGGKLGHDYWWGKTLTNGADQHPRAFVERQASKILCGFANGYAWQFGDGSTTQSLAARRVLPAAQQEGSMPVSVATFGNVVVLHEADRNEIVLFDVSNNTLLGAFRDPTKIQANMGPKVIYQSLWMDLHRIVAILPDGEVCIIMRLTPEAKEQRDKHKEREKEAAQRIYDQQLKELEEKAASLNIANAVTAATVDTEMTAAK